MLRLFWYLVSDRLTRALASCCSAWVTDSWADALSVADQRHVHDLARSLGGRLDVIGHPDAFAALHVRLPQQRSQDTRSA